MSILHPCPDDDGRPVPIRQPSIPTPLSSWSDPRALATVVPGGALPAALNGLPLAPWTDAPDTTQGWSACAMEAALDEPPFVLPAGMAAAAGAVILEDDGRVWLVAPSNRFGGYAATFPKGRVDPGTSLQCASVREAFEESGLRVRVDAFLLDIRRTQTYTRYYIARRTGGSPGCMGWESQAVHLAPLDRLRQVAVHPNDAPVIAALECWLGS
ncbi:NUDIX hydrolase [Massilia haematophila]|uniref:NUDIX hydrolase n=1 Tax=Massilia haematophila TaxID=457923 RepID=A0ABV7PJ26_9BURK